MKQVNEKLVSEMGLKLVLGSSSPRRAELLAALGVRFLSLSPKVDERKLDDPMAIAAAKLDWLVEHLSCSGTETVKSEKAHCTESSVFGTETGGLGSADIGIHDSGESRVVRPQLENGVWQTEPALLCADTIVMAGNERLTKPNDRAHAETILGSISGKTVLCVTATAFQIGRKRVLREAQGQVKLKAFDQTALLDYVQSGIADDKAGALAVQSQHPLIVEGIESIQGCPTAVLGLSLCAIWRDLGEAGVVPKQFGGQHRPVDGNESAEPDWPGFDFAVGEHSGVEPTALTQQALCEYLCWPNVPASMQRFSPF